MYDLDKFESGGYYIHLETQSKYDNVMKWLDNFGLKWGTGQKASSLNCWSCYDTCISYKYGSLGHQNEDYFVKEGFIKLETNEYKDVYNPELWHDGSGRSSNHFKIEIPKVYLDGNEIDYGVSEFPDINIPKLAQRLYEGVQKDMKVMSIKQLHNDIKNIYFNEDKRTTVIVFKNGDKVKATASKDTPFSEYAGFVTALFKYEKGLKLKDVEHLIKKKRG